MTKTTSVEKMKGNERTTILVAVDFSHCSRLAFRKAVELMRGRKGRIVAVHVIDSNFVHRCVHHRLGEEAKIKKELFLQAKERLHTFVRKNRGIASG